MGLGGRHAVLISLIVLACGGEVNDPSDDVSLRVNPTVVTVIPPNAPPAVNVYFVNTGRNDVRVWLCNIGGPNPPTAPLVLEEQMPDSTWHLVAPWIICPDPADGFDQVIAGGRELQIARLFPGNHGGFYRFQLTYSTAAGGTATVVSKPYQVVYP